MTPLLLMLLCPLVMLQALFGDLISSTWLSPETLNSVQVKKPKSFPSPHPYFLTRAVKAIDTTQFCLHAQLSAWRHHPPLDQGRNLNSPAPLRPSLLPSIPSVSHPRPTNLNSLSHLLAHLPFPALSPSHPATMIFPKGKSDVTALLKILPPLG